MHHDADLDFAFFQHFFAKSGFYDKHVALTAFGSNGAARDHQNVVALLRIDAEIDVYVGQKLEFVIVYRAQKLADAACAVRDNLFWNSFGKALPTAVRKGVPSDAGGEIGSEGADFRFVHESANTDFVKVGHFGKQVAYFHEVALTNRKRIECRINRSGDAAIADFCFEGRNFALRLLHLEAAYSRTEMNGSVELLLCGSETGDFGLCLCEFEFVRGKFVLCSGLLGEEALEGVVIALQTVAVCDGLSKITGDSGHVIGAATSAGGAKVVLRFEESGTSLGQRCGGILDVKLEEELALLDLLTLGGENFFDESVELSANDIRRDRLNFAVAADGRDDVFAGRINSGELGDGLTATE